MLETYKYSRKQFSVDAVQITELNMADVAAWVGGTIEEADGKKYVSVNVKNPLNDRQSQGSVGDWVLRGSSGFKVYRNKAFRSVFEQESVETTFHDVSPKPVVVTEVVQGSLPGVTPEQLASFHRVAEGIQSS